MMAAWSVGDSSHELQIAVIAPTRGRAKAIAMFDFFDGDFIDLRCRRVRSPIAVEGPERILEVPESLEHGFRWNNETMDDYFPGWYQSWLCERQPYD